MRVAVSGLGSIGLQHLRAVQSLGGHTAIGFDPTPELRARAEAEIGCLEGAYASFEDLLDQRPDALVVAGPDKVHIPQALAAHAAGIPVLVEKPVADRVAAAREAAEELASGSPVLVGYVLHHWPLMRRAAGLIADGIIGVPVAAQVALGAYQTIVVAKNRFATAECGRLYRDYSHEWDYLRWFFGDINRVFAVERTLDCVEHVESPNAVDGLVEAGGVLATVHIDYVDPAGLRQITVLGSGGNLTLDAGGGHLRCQPVGAAPILEQRPMGPGEGLALQMAHLLDVASGKEPPAVTWADGVAALTCADALRRSAETGAWEEVRAGAGGPS